MTGSHPLAQMGHQRGQILQPLPQRREVEWEDIEAKEEVLPKSALPHLLLQRAVGGGHHPHIHPQRPLRADALKLPGFQGAEQFRLGFGAQVSHLVEKERALVGQLEPAESPLTGTGERPALVPEHLGLDQVPRDRRAVHRDERPPRPAAGGVNRGGHQLLAGARFAGDEHPSLGGRHPRDEGAHLAHGRAVADEGAPAGQLRVQRAILRPGPVELQCRPHRHQHRFRGERLLQELERSLLHRAHGVGELGLATHHDDRCRPAAIADPDQGLQAVRTGRHQQV